MRSRLRVVYFGRGDYFAATFLDAIELDHDLVGIMEARPGQSHAQSLARSAFDALRGRTSLRLRARRRRIPYVYWSPGGTLEDLLIRLEPDAGCIASFPRLLPERIFGRFRLGVLNYHPSLLPAYRGPLPLLWQYFFEEPQMGVSVHLIDAGEDTGDIVAQQALPDLLDWRPDSLEKSDGAATLAETIGRVGYRFFVHHPEGRIWLSPHFGLTFVRRALQRRLLPGV